MITYGKSLTILGLLAALTAGYTWGIPAAVNVASHKQFIEQKIFEQSGIKVDIGNPSLSMGLFPSVKIATDSVSVINSDESNALLITNPKCKIKLLPLLFKNIELVDVSADNADVNLIFSKNKEFYLGDYPLKFNNNQKLKLNLINFNLGPYNVKLDDKLNNQQVSINGEYLKDGFYKRNQAAKLITNGNFTVENISTPYAIDFNISLPINKFHEDKFKISGSIENFDLSSISDYVSILSGGIIQEMKGIINFNAVTKDTVYRHKRIFLDLIAKNLDIKGKDQAERIYQENDIVLKANFETINDGIDFKNTTLNTKNVEVSLNGAISGIGEKLPSFNDFIIEIKNTRAEEVCKIMLWARNLVQEMDFYALKKYVFYGDGEGKLTFKGKGRYPHVYGDVKIRNAYLMHPIKGSPGGAKVDLNFKGQTMDVDVFVPVSSTQSVEVKGTAKTDGSKYSELNIESTDSVNMAIAHEVLNPLHEILRFKLGPLPIMKVSGFGNIKLRSAGKKVDPHLFGVVNFRNANASFNQIHNLELTNASGEVLFEDTVIKFKNYNGLINGQKAEINGKSTVLGKLDVIAKTWDQDIPKIIKVINSSEDLADVQKVVKPFTNPHGKADLLLNIYGVAKDAEKIEFNKDLFAKGTLTIHNGVTTLKDTYLPLSDINGIVNFKDKDADYNLNGYVRDSKVFVSGTASDKTMNLTAKSDLFTIKDCFDLLYPELNLPYKDEIGQMKVSFTGGYNGIADSENLDFSKVKAKGKILSNMRTQNAIRTEGADFSIDNGNLNVAGMKGLFNENPFTLSFTATNIYDKLKIANAIYDFEDFNLASIQDIKNQVDLPSEIGDIFDKLDDISGIIDIKGNIKNGKINSDTNLENISFIYKPYDAMVKILNGKANIRSNNLYLSKINTRISSMPLFLDGSIADILHKQKMNLYLSAKPTQMFFDRFFNTKSVYPIKVKGDVNVNARVSGTFDQLHVHSTLDVKENSSLYYMGATLVGAPTGSLSDGEVTTNPISVTTDALISGKTIKLNSLNYNQNILSQNQKTSVQNQLISSGVINLLEDNVLGFKDFKIKTNSPTDARIFNILLKKPTIKQGVFNADILINGTSIAPNVLGYLNITSVDIPLLDATIKDIMVDFDKDMVDLKAKGIILTNDINLDAKVHNTVTPPYIVEDAKIQMDVLDLNIIGQRLNDLDVDSLRNNRIDSQSSNSNALTIQPSDIIIKNAQILADKILIKKAAATDFKANLTISPEHIVNVDNYSFNLAQGTVDGDITVDLDKMLSSATMNLKNANAELISENFFDLPGQMYGDVNGDLKVSCKGFSSIDCVKTLSGEGNFEVNNGRMPKLGSLEYLLKAGNLITGGVTAVSINGIIDLITPLKTGNFDSIRGEIKVKDGIANEINVYSSGKDLNMYMTGTYDFMKLVADMEIYGSLSADFSSLLGIIRNMSLNRLLNRIPGIAINKVNPRSTSNINKIPNFDKSKVLRVFKAEIYGDINGSNYVKSFHWIKH